MQILRKEDLLSWFDELCKEYTLVGPTAVDGVVLFQPISKVDCMVNGWDSALLPPKQYFFPPTEVLFWIDQKDEQKLVTQTIEKETIIFGIRPCDAYALSLIDKVFLEEPLDYLYMQHRNKTTLIGLACIKPVGECFCTSFHSHPHDSSNLDALLIPIDEGYTVQIVTDKGRNVFSTAILTEVEVSIPLAPIISKLPVEGIWELMEKLFDSVYWERLADRCIQCNICAYVCPTCYCFNIRDYINKNRTERVRSWDSCQARSFTRQAGGIDPRTTKGARLKQRLFHKVLYFYQKFGVICCVGCGRCIRSCPVNIDIREVIMDISKLQRR